MELTQVIGMVWKEEVANADLGGDLRVASWVGDDPAV